MIFSAQKQLRIKDKTKLEPKDARQTVEIPNNQNKVKTRKMHN